MSVMVMLITAAMWALLWGVLGALTVLVGGPGPEAGSMWWPLVAMGGFIMGATLGVLYGLARWLIPVPAAAAATPDHGKRIDWRGRLIAGVYGAVIGAITGVIATVLVAQPTYLMIFPVVGFISAFAIPGQTPVAKHSSRH